MKQFIYYIIPLLILCSACQREEDVDLSVPYKRKLIAAVFIGAGDSSIDATLNYTSPVLGYPPIMDAQQASAVAGILKIGTTDFPFQYDTIDKQYKTGFLPDHIQPGNTLEVTFADSKEVVAGRTTVPYPVQVDIQFQIDSMMINEIPQYKATFTTTLITASGYVKIVPLLLMSDSITEIPMYSESFKPINLLHKGQSFSFSCIAASQINGLYPIRVRCLVVACDEAYAHYANSTQSLDFTNTLPGSEPLLVYSNMSNHIGVMASYNICDQKIFMLR